MATRTPMQPCLLCDSGAATQTNSHIFPKFMSTNFLGTPRRGFDLDSETVLFRNPKVIQDSPKENFLLCPDCEDYFSILETESAKTLQHWKRRFDEGTYPIREYGPNLSVTDCVTANSAILRLMVYSIFWRSAVTSDKLFINFKLSEDLKENLRNILLHYKSSSLAELISKLQIAQPQFAVYPFAIKTATSFIAEDANILFAGHASEPYSLIIDKWALLLYKDANNIKDSLGGILKKEMNIEVTDCKLMVFNDELWHGAVIETAFDLFVKAAKKPD